MVFMLPRYYNQPYAASLHKSFNDNYDEVFREDNQAVQSWSENESLWQDWQDIYTYQAEYNG
jgi:hypothetical protein